MLIENLLAFTIPRNTTPD